MKIGISVLLIGLLSAISTVPSFAAGDRYALVIGNSKYPAADAPLKEPINDANDVADELKRDGFSVEIGENLTHDAMLHAFDRLYAKLHPGAVALLFYSGFGIQSERQSFMIPVDAQIWGETDVRRDGINLEKVLGEMNNRGAGVKIALIDASRRNPWERRFRTSSAGLAPVIAPSGSLVMYSAALSAVISENTTGHSLFVQELLNEIRVPDLAAEETLNRTRVGVTRASRGEQVPWVEARDGVGEIHGERLKRPPAGFDPQHSLIEDLKQKDFIASRTFSEAEACGTEFVDRYAEACRERGPLMRFLTRAVGLAWE